MQKYAFLIGREPDLSLAELKSIFSEVEHRGDFAFVEAEEKDIDAHKKGLGGTIKIGLILAEGLKKQELCNFIAQKASEKIQPEKKLRIGIDSFIPSLMTLVFKVKDALREGGHSIRVVQHDQGRIKNATTIHEKLIEQGIEFIIFADKIGFTVAKTVWIQDIESYSDRDMNRDRSMTVGMMPPKLAQIMVNLGTKGKYDTIVWDPFCGLGTTLIEALHAGHVMLQGSDLEKEMVSATQKNIEKRPGYDKNNIHVCALDATKLDTLSLSKKTTVITEGMLGRNFTPATLTQQAALQERKKLTQLYQDFLDSGYKNINIECMVFCLPFWNAGRDIVFMPEVSQLSKDWGVDNLCISRKRYISHSRPGQSVGREIVIVRR
ncbi:hypothetical protein KA071_00865 [Candidatus Gracilibacteria bacterium]|nr:hypothetical protein [Candidatus Gracilibacteria bacterium]